MKVLVVLGTRPEAIKLWPVITELKRREIETVVVSTNQQKDLLPPILEELGIEPDDQVPTGGDPFGTLGTLSGQLFCYLAHLRLALTAIKPDWVLVQGDTTTALAGALAAFYAGVKVGHVEAGLRSGHLSSPFPEEGNRRMISQIASMHFAPTWEAFKNLEREVPGEDRIPLIETGNTIVDALQRMLARAEFTSYTDMLVTFHRREAWDRVEEVAEQVFLASQRLGLGVRWILHGNPDLAQRVEKALKHTNVETVRPMGYREFIHQLNAARCVVTDSGGVIEEAYSLGKKLVIVRDKTERPEAVGVGVGRVGFDHLDELPEVVERVLSVGEPRPSDAFGDGKAASRIVDALLSQPDPSG